MKTRFVSFFIMFVFVLALLVPTPAYAQPATPSDYVNLVPAAGQTTASLTVNNTSGGTLRVALAGPKNYYFSTSKTGKATFTGIEPGTYKITLSASTCTDSITVSKKLNGKVSLKETVCAKKASKSNSSGKSSSLAINNKTGGTIYISLTGPHTYYFSTAKGHETFEGIESGKYTIVVTASACGGSLSYEKRFNGRVSLPAFVCR